MNLKEESIFEKDIINFYTIFLFLKNNFFFLLILQLIFTITIIIILLVYNSYAFKNSKFLNKDAKINFDNQYNEINSYHDEQYKNLIYEKDNNTDYNKSFKSINEEFKIIKEELILKINKSKKKLIPKTKIIVKTNYLNTNPLVKKKLVAIDSFNLINNLENFLEWKKINKMNINFSDLIFGYPDQAEFNISLLGENTNKNIINQVVDYLNFSINKIDKNYEKITNNFIENFDKSNSIALSSYENTLIYKLRIQNFNIAKIKLLTLIIITEESPPLSENKELIDIRNKRDQKIDSLKEIKKLQIFKLTEKISSLDEIRDLKLLKLNESYNEKIISIQEKNSSKNYKDFVKLLLFTLFLNLLIVSVYRSFLLSMKKLKSEIKK